MQLVFWISIAWVIYSYIAYPLILPLCARLFQRPVMKKDDEYPTVAILIPVYNEGKIIRFKIENILALDYPAERKEIWVGSDCSTDATHDIVRRFGSDRIHLWIAPLRGGKTEVLNHVAPLINADIILFTDANTVHRPDSLKKMVRSFADPGVGGVAGAIRHRSTNKETEERVYRWFESKQKYFESLLHSSISAFGGFYSIRKSLFKTLPSNSYSNDDVLIPMNIIRQQYRIIFEPEALSEEDMTESIAQEYIRRIRIGAGNFQAFFWLLDFLNPFRGWPAFCYLSHKVSRWFSPFFLGAAFICSCVLWVLHSTNFFLIVSAIGLFSIAIGLSFLVFPCRINRPAFYFFSMNIALIGGFLRYCKGIQSAVWSRTEREAEKSNSIDRSEMHFRYYLFSPQKE